jgi:hypothetical protein
MRNLLFLSLCLWALAQPLRAVAGPPDIVVVRIYEGATVTAIITRGAGKSEKVEFPAGVSDKNLTRTSEGYYLLFEKLYQEGYALQSTMPTANSPATSFLTLLFVRGK